MNPHENAYQAMTEAVKVVATSGEEIEYSLMAACRDFIRPLTENDFCPGLLNNFKILSKKLHLDEDDYQDLLLQSSPTEAAILVRAICDFSNTVVGEYYVPDSFNTYATIIES